MAKEELKFVDVLQSMQFSRCNSVDGKSTEEKRERLRGIRDILYLRSTTLGALLKHLRPKNNTVAIVVLIVEYSTIAILRFSGEYIHTGGSTETFQTKEYHGSCWGPHM